jgi:putative inorganic carbon (hco3(-)) transporter
LPTFLDAIHKELPRAGLLRWASIFFSLSVLTILLSVAASQTFFTLAGALYAVHLLRHPEVPRFPPVKLPLALFCLTTIISIGWAENPVIGWLAVRKFTLFLILLFALNLILTRRHLVALYASLFAESAAAGVLSVWQFVEQYREVRIAHPGRIYRFMTLYRITGFLGHWINFGGQQMLVFVAMVGFLLLAGREAGRAGGERPERTSRRTRALAWLAFALVCLSILLNLSRGVWVGCFVGGVYLVARWRARWLLALPVLAAVALVAAPKLVRERAESIVQPQGDSSVAMRVEMLRVGLNMVRRHPWVGVGPNNIPEVYDLYLPPHQAPIPGYHDHLHNNFVQFAAERGLPCLAAWMWLMAALGWHCWRIRGQKIRLRWLAEAGFAAWLAMLVEGTFEFSFGSTPVLMLFLFVIASPFVVQTLDQTSAE